MKLSPFSAVTLAAVACSGVAVAAYDGPPQAEAAVAAPGQGFNLNAGDMKFILKQINRREPRDQGERSGQPVPGQPLVGPGEFQIANPLLPFGLRTVDGSENNIQPGQDTFGAADH
ncbi:MAG: hypothetical protein H0U79_02310 [Solirubrobacterales bacterium]|nr:hypothetical protein [Solirubrobacterales bacterium]